MLEHIKSSWDLFLRSPRGRRFQDLHERSKSERKRKRRGMVLMILGVGVVLLGLVMLVIPGPGLLIVAAGLMLVAAESMIMARWLDLLDLKFVGIWRWGQRTGDRLGPVKCFILGVGVGCAAMFVGIAIWGWLT